MQYVRSPAYPGYEWPEKNNTQVLSKFTYLRRIYTYSPAAMRNHPTVKHIVLEMVELGVRPTPISDTPVDKPPAA